MIPLKIILKLWRRSKMKLKGFEIFVIFALIVYICYLINLFVFSRRVYNKSTKKPDSLFNFETVTKTKHPLMEESEAKCQVTVAIILCEDDRYLTIKKMPTNLTANFNSSSTPSTPPPQMRQKVAKDFSRQVNQTLVLLKSIAILMAYEDNSREEKDFCVEALLLSDKSTHYKLIHEKIKTSWSSKFRKLVKVTHVPVRYPPGSSWMKNLFRPCATLRLFLAELLPPKWDSVLYLDTDIIFFQSVQKLWSQLERFDDESEESDNDDADDDETSGNGKRGKNLKLAAMAPCLVHYGTSANSVPYFGTSGLNAGIMLMNLTRIRTSQWTNKIRMVTTMFQDKIKLADQDILNIYFHFFPEELHLLSCDWNFRPFQCRPTSYCDDPELSRGISALHGNALSFTPQGPEPLFRSVFQTFHRVKLDDKFDLKKFVLRLEGTLAKTEANTPKYSSQCKQFGELDVLLLNRLYNLVER